MWTVFSVRTKWLPHWFKSSIACRIALRRRVRWRQANEAFLGEELIPEASPRHPGNVCPEVEQITLNRVGV